ncbi:acetyltransferase [Vibrio cholerae]|nr:acetyltransferase [Vibrio cholerae]
MRWLRLLCLSFVVMRCQPLRRALAAYWRICSFSCTS